MAIPYHQRPSVGFGILTAAVVATVGFFGWGLRQPALDVVWRLELELELGERPILDDRERKVLEDALLQYPALADDLLDGARALISNNDNGWVNIPYAYLIRKDAAAITTVTITPSASKKKPIRICIRAGSDEQCGEAHRATPFSWAAPDAAQFPQLIEVRIGKNKQGTRAVHIETTGAS